MRKWNGRDLLTKEGIMDKEGMISLLGGLFLFFLLIFGLCYLDYKKDIKFIEEGYTITTLPGLSEAKWVKQ